MFFSELQTQGTTVVSWPLPSLSALCQIRRCILGNYAPCRQLRRPPVSRRLAFAYMLAEAEDRSGQRGEDSEHDHGHAQEDAPASRQSKTPGKMRIGATISPMYMPPKAPRTA